MAKTQKLAAGKSRTIGDFPTYVDCVNRRDKLIRQRAEVERRFAAASEGARPDAQADAILRGESALVVAAEDPARLIKARELLDAAIARTNREARQATLDASREVCAESADDHRAILLKILDGVSKVVEAIQEEQQFRRSLARRGFRLLLPGVKTGQIPLLARAVRGVNLRKFLRDNANLMKGD